MTIKSISSNDNLIFYALESGEPDPTDKKPIGKDTRPRVVDKGNIGPFCFYTAMGLIRDRIGEVSEGFEDQRIIELQCMNWHTEISKACNPQEKNATIFFQSMQKANEIILEAFEKEPKQVVHTFWKRSTRDALINDPIIIQMGQCRQVDDMLEEQFPHIQQKAKELKPHIENEFLFGCANLEMATQFGLKRSSWVPGKNVKGLVETLKEHGPMLIVGNFGPTFYVKAPSVMSKKINEHEISYWEAGSKRSNPCTFMSHAVVLVGAQLNPPLIYYVDPNDSSEPNQQRRVYCNSYKFFIENLRSLAGIPTSESLQSAAIGYTLFSPHLKEYLK